MCCTAFIYTINAQIFSFALDHSCWQEAFELRYAPVITVRCYSLTDNTAQRKNMISWVWLYRRATIRLLLRAFVFYFRFKMQCPSRTPRKYPNVLFYDAHNLKMGIEDLTNQTRYCTVHTHVQFPPTRIQPDWLKTFFFLGDLLFLRWVCPLKMLISKKKKVSSPSFQILKLSSFWWMKIWYPYYINCKKNTNETRTYISFKKEPYFVEPFLQIALQGRLDLGFFSNYTQRTLKASWTTFLDPF